MTKTTVKVIQDPDNPDELVLDLGDKICDELGWKEGDTLIWEVDEQNNIVVRRDDSKP